MTVTAVSTTSATLVLGQQWLLDVSVTDVDGCPVADTVVFSVTDPEQADTTSSTETVETGRYRTVVTPVTEGRYVAVAAGAAYGAAAFTAWVQAVSDAVDFPDVTELDSYLGTNGATTDELQEALDAQGAAQRADCRIPPVYGADLRSALLRRCARHLALKRIPLAVLQGDAENGPTTLPRNDPMVRDFERNYRKLTMG